MRPRQAHRRSTLASSPRPVQRADESNDTVRQTEESIPTWKHKTESALANGAAFPVAPSAVKFAVIYLASWSILLLGLDRYALNLFDEGRCALWWAARSMGRRTLPRFLDCLRSQPSTGWLPSCSRSSGLFIIVERAWDAAVRAGLRPSAYMVAKR